MKKALKDENSLGSEAPITITPLSELDQQLIKELRFTHDITVEVDEKGRTKMTAIPKPNK